MAGRMAMDANLANSEPAKYSVVGNLGPSHVPSAQPAGRSTLNQKVIPEELALSDIFAYLASSVLPIDRLTGTR